MLEHSETQEANIQPSVDPVVSALCEETERNVLAQLPAPGKARWPVTSLVLVLLGVSFATLGFLPQQKLTRSVIRKMPVSVMQRLHGAASSGTPFGPENLSSAPDRSTSSDVSNVPVESSSASVQTESSVSAGHGATPVPEPIKIVPIAPPPPIPHVPDAHRGVYLSAGSVQRTQFFTDTMVADGAAGGNALVIDVKGDRVYYNSTAQMPTDLQLIVNLYNLADVVKDAKSRGMYVIARYVAVSDAGLTAKLPDTQVKSPKTGNILSYGYIDPANEQALAYNSQIICEVAQAGVDEINLDYIRFSTANFGALKVFSGKEKADHVEQFIKMSRDTIDRCNPKTKLGLSTFAILGWDYDVNVETLGQDVVRFAPLVDIISPMAYPATFDPNSYYDPRKNTGSRMYYLVWRTLTGYEKLLGDDAWKLRPWIQGYGTTVKNEQDEMQAVADAGLCGFQVWNAGNNYGNTYEAMKSWHSPSVCPDAPMATSTH